MAKETDGTSQLTQTCPACGALLDVTQEDPLAKVHCPMCGSGVTVERQYNHFKILEVLGRGGMGAVYRAEDLSLKRQVALKILRRDIGQEAEHRRQLENEARITASINHPHVVKVFTFGEDHGQFYLAMELVDKGSLDDLMQLQKRVAEAQILHVGIQIAQGLRAAAEAGLIHRDVKPGNILFADPHTAKIVDFGLALLMEKEAEARGEVWGTPYYIAPEKLNNEAEDFRSDIYSLGASLFHAVAGRPPFEAESASLVALKHLKSRAVSLQAFAPDVSSETAFVINRMLHRNPEERYASYDELIEHLQFASHSLQEKMQRPRSPKQRVVVETDLSKRIMGWLTLFTLVAILGALVFFGIWMVADKPKPLSSGAQVAGEMVLTAEDFRDTIAPGQRERLDEGMRLMQIGMFSQAREVLMAMAGNTTEPLPQPALNWVRLLAATAALFSGDRAAAYGSLNKLSDEALFSTGPTDLALADFFRRAGVLFAESGVLTAAEVSRFQTKEGQALLILLAGLNNWQSGSLGEGTEVLTLFLASDTNPPLTWVNQFHAPVQSLLDQRERILALETEAEAAGSQEALEALDARLEEMNRALTEGDVLRTEIGRIQRFIDTRKRVLLDQARREEARRQAEAAAQAAAEREAALASEEGPRWIALTRELQPDLNRFEYGAAQRKVETAKFESSQYQAEQAALMGRLAALEGFLDFLRISVQLSPYPEPVASLNGSRYSTGLTGYQAGRFLSRTPYGELEIPLVELAPTTLLAIGQHYWSGLEAEEKARVLTLAALFALENGLETQANEWSAEATALNPAATPAAADPQPLLGNASGS